MNIRTEAVHQLQSHPLELPPAPLCPPLALVLLFSGLTARLGSADSSVAALLHSWQTPQTRRVSGTNVIPDLGRSVIKEALTGVTTA